MQVVRLRATVISCPRRLYALILDFEPLFTTLDAIPVPEFVAKGEEVFLHECNESVEGTIVRIEHYLGQG